MYRLGGMLIALLLSVQVMAAGVYSAILDGQYTGPLPSVTLNAAQQRWLQQKEQLTLGVSEPNYPPFDIINFNSEYVGITADYAALIAAVLHIPIRVKVFDSRQEAIAALDQGEIDFLGTANGYDGNDKTLILSLPYAEDNPVFAGRSDHPGKLSGNLAGVSVAMVYHYLPPQWVFETYPGIILKMYPSNLSAMGSVSFGQNDLFLGDNTSAEFLSSRRVFNNIVIERQANLPKTQFAFALSRDETTLLTLLNSVIHAFTPEQQQQILTRWGAKPRMAEKDKDIVLDANEQQWRDSHPVLRVALEDTNEPFSFFTTGGEPYGINADVLKEVARMAGIQLVWHKVDNGAQARNALRKGLVDITVAVTDSQQSPPPGISYSPTFYRDSYAISSRADRQLDTDDLAALSLRVAVVNRDPILKVLHDDYPLMRPMISDDANHAFKMLDEGKVDAVIVSLSESVFNVDNYYKDRLKIDAVFTNRSLQLSIAMADNQPQLLSILSKAISAISPARMSELNNHWRGKTVVERNFWNKERQTFLRGFLLLSAFVIVLLFWIYWLRSLIKRRDRAELTLNDQLTFMRDLIDGTPLPIYVRDRQGKLLLCNNSYRQQLKIPMDEVLGKTVYEILDDDGERTDELEQTYRRVIEYGESIVNDRILRLGENDYRIIHHWILPYRNGAGETLGVIGGWYDISERQQHLERLQIDKDQAVQASEAKSTFLTTMSHEIRTPMNVIIGMLELAVKQADAGIVDKRSLNIASSEAQGLLELIGDILDIERAESGYLSLSEQPGNLRKLVHSVCRLFEALARRKGLGFKLHETGTLDHDVLIDPLRFKQIISNLLSNALKFTDKGEISVNATVEELNDDLLQLTICITDSGIGISAEDSQKLFSRFARASNNTLSSQQSSGLGLLICKTLSEMMGGTLTLESQLGEGTRTQVVLPLRRSHPLHPTASQPATLGVQEKQRVLIVDDYAANREILTLQLASFRHDVTAARDGREALAIWQQGEFDLVITDCNMPLMDGYELSRRIRHHEDIQGLPRIKIIGLTANAVNEERGRCLDAGMDDCLFKPVTLAMLAPLFELRTEPPAMTVAGEKVFDLTELKVLTNNDPAKLGQLLQTFISGIIADLKQLESAVATGDRAYLFALAHRIKGGAELIKAQQVVEACSQLEIHCEKDEQVEGLVSQLRAALERLSASLSQEIQAQTL